ncbi:MAG: ComF family protein [bacterium]|jgi:ComF family protein|nr:ComF family protein [candidate division KSB1 bacterium]MDH7558680.1 ComF family protein [bacterium]
MGQAVTWQEKLMVAFAPLLDFVLPPYCVLCQAHLEIHEFVLCTNCWLGLPTCPQPVIAFGGQRGKGSQHPYLSTSFSVWRYSPEVQEVIHLFKYRGYQCLAHPLGLALGGALQAVGALATSDLLVPVPLHPARKRERGYNQSELLARTASKICGIRVETELLRRTRYTTPQAKLGAAERTRNVAGAFAVSAPAHVQGRGIILVDDVFTTGATANECARVLLQAGAREVSLATMARA